MFYVGKTMKLLSIILFFIASFAVPTFVFAENDCLSCAQRKVNYCSQECALVPPERIQECQKLCVKQYCSHKCNPDTVDKELEGIFNLGCEECREQQFSLCSSSCDLKSEYKKAACQIDCAVKRCLDKCK